MDIPLEIEIVFNEYQSNRAHSHTHSYDPTDPQMTIKRGKYVSNKDIVLLFTSITVIKPNYKCRQTRSGKHEDAKCKAKIISFPKEFTDNIGIFIKIDDKAETCCAKIVNMNDR